MCFLKLYKSSLSNMGKFVGRPGSFFNCNTVENMFLVQTYYLKQIGNKQSAMVA